MRMPDRRFLWMGLGLAVATLVFYAGILGNGFVNYDDDLYITARPEIAAGLSAESVQWAFTSLQGANWFPLTRLSWLLDAELHGVQPRGFHATSLVIHLANVLLLFWGLTRLTGERGASAFVAGVFALHPLHVESVAWASSRKDVLAGLFFMLALLVHERVARSERPWGWGALLLLVAALGLMAKPVLVTLPCVLLLLDVWPLERLRGEEGRFELGRVLRPVLEKLPLFALVAGASAVTLWAQDASGALQGGDRYPFLLRLGNFCQAVGMYVAQSFWPRDLAVYYPHPMGNLDAWKVGIGAWLILGVSWWAVRRVGARPYAAVGWLWFLGMLIPSSGILQVGQASRADRYTYLPLIGLAIVLAWGARELVARWPGLRVGVQRAAVVVLALLGFLTVDQVRVWRDSRTLFEHALEVTENNHVAHINLGLSLLQAGRPGEAEPHLSRAIAITPGSALARGIRGEARVALGRPVEAEPDLQAAARIEPARVRWASARARTLADLERLDEAESVLREALRANPEDAELHALLGTLLARRAPTAEAQGHLRAALAREDAITRSLGTGGLALVHAQLGLTLAQTGEPDRGLPHLERAVELEPGNSSYRASQGRMLESVGRPTEAVAAYRASIERGATSLQVLNNLAWLLATADDPAHRDPGEAVRLAQDAARRSSYQDAGVLDTLAMSYLAAGRDAQALAMARRALDLAESQERTDLAADIRARFPGLNDGRASGAPDAGAGA